MGYQWPDTWLFNQFFVLNLCVFYDRHSFQNVHKPISGQLAPVAAPNRFSDDTVQGEKNIARWNERKERYM